MSKTEFATMPVSTEKQHDVHWFAGLAMQAIIAKQPTVPDTESEREEVALWSYRMGQAMIATQKRLGIESE